MSAQKLLKFMQSPIFKQTLCTILILVKNLPNLKIFCTEYFDVYSQRN